MHLNRWDKSDILVGNGEWVNKSIIGNSSQQQQHVEVVITLEDEKKKKKRKKKLFQKREGKKTGK